MSKKTSKKINPTLSETIRNKILSCGLSQYKIAQETGIDSGVLSRFVTRERSIKMETAEKLCKALGLELVEVEKQE